MSEQAPDSPHHDDQPLDLGQMFPPHVLGGLESEARNAVRGTPSGYADSTTGSVRLPGQHAPGNTAESGLVLEQVTEEEPSKGKAGPTWREWLPAPELFLSAAARKARKAELEHAAAHHARHSHLYLGRMVKAFAYGARYVVTNTWAHFTAADSYADDIAKAKAAKGRKVGEASGNDWVRALKAERAQLGRERRREALPILGASAATSYVSVLVAVAEVWGLLMAGALLLPGLIALMSYGQREHARRHPDLTPLIYTEPVYLAADAPLGKESLENAFKRMGLIKNESEIHLVGLPRAVAVNAVELTIELPDECDLDKLEANKGKIAQAFRVRPEWIDLREDGHPGRVIVWMAARDPFGQPFTSPVAENPEQQDVWGRGVLIGYNRRGEPIYIKLKHVMALLGGTSRAGKGMILRNIMIGLGLDPRVNIRLVAGAKPGEHRGYSAVCATFFGRRPARLIQLLEAFLAEAYRREEWLEDQGRAKMSEADLALFPLEILIVDEYKQYAASNVRIPDYSDPEGKRTIKASDRIADLLEEAAAFVAALNMTILVSTQDPDANTIPRGYRSNASARIATRTRSATQTNAILSDGATGAGLRAHDIREEDRGAAIVDIDGSKGELIRSCFIEDEHFDGAANAIGAGRALRESLGRAPGQFPDPIETQLLRMTGLSSIAGGPNGSGRPGQPGADVLPLLEQILTAFPKAPDGTRADKVKAADVRSHLAAEDPDRWGLNEEENPAQYESRVGTELAAAIAEVLKGSGAVLKPKAGIRFGKRPDGTDDKASAYLLKDVEAALAATRIAPK
ncbi:MULTISPECIES: hypothetical protein [unclassified Streptomyces]|uniref:hypothetical protein n=1 Tax=unclassified Streptomyces TaxID=2593676 RepID=UPI000DC78CCB|nr:MULTISPECIES: hypothetical protein [unclassified Streptomyces]AWZ09798.1 hypothetical protein DRB89_41395 [Streptomyces sp. ICC4]AWZ12635.1 hypothetical protein DRB96_10230 [Streptomyces sp. ICC1]